MGLFVKKHLALMGNDNLFVDLENKAIDLEEKGNFKAGHLHCAGIFQKI